MIFFIKEKLTFETQDMTIKYSRPLIFLIQQTKCRRGMNQYSESALKNIKFGNEIRNRNRQQYFRKLRQEFLQLQELANGPQYLNLTIEDITKLIEEQPSKRNIQALNSIIIKQRQCLTQNALVRISHYILNNFLAEKENSRLVGNAFLNDYIALFSSILTLPKFQQRANQIFNMEEAAQKMLDLINKVNFKSGELLIWLLYSLCRAGPASLTALIAPKQEALRQRFGLVNPNLIHLYCQLGFHAHSCIESSIINELLEVRIDSQTRKEFCFNIVDILQKNYQNRQSGELAAKILAWIGVNLSNLNFPAQAKSQVITLLYVLIRQRLQIEQLAWLLSSDIINQIIQRAQFDSNFYNKCISTFVLCELLRTLPVLHLQILVFGFPELIQVFTDALGLLQNDVIMDCLRAIIRIVLVWPNRKDVWRMIQDAQLESEVQLLSHSPCSQIASLAASILEEYLQK